MSHDTLIGILIGIGMVFAGIGIVQVTRALFLWAANLRRSPAPPARRSWLDGPGPEPPILKSFDPPFQGRKPD